MTTRRSLFTAIPLALLAPSGCTRPPQPVTRQPRWQCVTETDSEEALRGVIDAHGYPVRITPVKGQGVAEISGEHRGVGFNLMLGSSPVRRVKLFIPAAV